MSTNSSRRFCGCFRMVPRLTLLTLLACGGATVAQAQGVSFQPAVNLPVQSGPESIAVGDFNGDGIPDLAVVNGGSDSVSVLLGNPDGSFQEQVNYGVGTHPWFVAVADLNGDGVGDLVVSNRDSGDLTVLLGTGDGTFEPAGAIRLSENPASHPFSVAVGDFNSDGSQDLAVTDLTTTFLLFGNGDGSFSEPVALDAKDTGPNTWFVAVGDFNGDTIQDLAVTNYPGDTITILLGNGDGTFKRVVGDPFSVHWQPNSVAVGDFDGDGNLDLVVANTLSARFSFLLGNGDGTFQSQVDYLTAPFPYSVVAGDFNGDGILDVATVGSGGNTVQVRLGNGDGTFGDIFEFEVGNEAHFVVAGDFNLDGQLDLAVANSASDNISLLYNDTLSN